MARKPSTKKMNPEVDIFEDEDVVFDFNSDEETKTFKAKVEKALSDFKAQVDKESAEKRKAHIKQKTTKTYLKEFHQKINEWEYPVTINHDEIIFRKKNLEEYVVKKLNAECPDLKSNPTSKQSEKSNDDPYKQLSTPFYKSKIVEETNAFMQNENAFYRVKSVGDVSVEKLPDKLNKDMSPSEIYSILDEYLYGLTDYKKSISTLLWKIMNNHRPEGALLVSGQSGCGKTEMISLLQKIYPVIRVANGASVIHSGYRNGSYGILVPLYYLLKEAEAHPGYKPIFVIDEFDKFLDNNKGANSHGELSAIPELFRILEGDKVPVQINRDTTVEITTNDVVFIFAGSFSGLAKKNASIGFGTDKHASRASVPSKDKIESTLPPELRGRIEDTVFVDEFTVDDFEKIMRSKKYSPLYKIGKKYGIEIKAKKSFIERVCQKAYDDGTGVRALYSGVMRELNQALFDNPDTKKLILK